MDISNSNVLVTGGAGFIGSNLCDELLSQDCNVVCLDNFSTGKMKNIIHIIEDKRFKLMVGDIRDHADCKKAVAGVDYVLHEAALGSVPRSIKDPIESNAVNVTGFLNVLTASYEAGVKRFIYAASSSVYGNSQQLPKTEDVIGRPLSPYAVTKYTNELYADVFSQRYGIECIGLRYFNVFGQRQDPDSTYAAVIPSFINKLIKLESPVINGDGTYSRDFTYIKNVIDMSLLALSTDNKKAINTVYNTAFGEKTTLNQLVELLKENLKEYNPSIAQIQATYGPKRDGDIPHSLANIEKSKKLLGYTPRYSINEGVKDSAQWYWNNLI